MPRIVVVLALLLLSAAAHAQSVRLQLFDHIVGTDLVHNAPLPSGTDVFVISKAETRAVRLRGGYSEVVQNLAGARQDRVGANGQTQGTYVPTARAERVYYVAARLPDGRVFQSFVKTADAGWQPGFDAVTGGRVSMGRVPGVMEATLRAALPPRPAPRPAAATPGTAVSNATPPAAAPGTPAPASSGPAASGVQDAGSPPPAALAAADSTRTDSTGTDTTVTATTMLDSLGALETVPPNAVRLDEPEAPPASRGWLWLLAGLVVGAGVTALVFIPRYERRLREQREHLMRLVPMSGARTVVSPQRREAQSAAAEADATRAERTLAQIEELKDLVRTRDAEILRLRADQDPGEA